MREEIIGDCRLILGDCREILPTLGKVDALVADPPYGIGVAENGRNGGGTGGKGTWIKNYKPTVWDACPPHDAINSAIQIADYQIIFGGNYFHLPPTSCWLVWDKQTTGNFADCELAWTNLKKPVRRIVHLWNGLCRKNLETRYNHPTQKPVGVMEWCIKHLPESCQTILDPFMGSGTTMVACAKMGRKGIGIEVDPDYFDIACRRVEQAYKQPDLFIEPPKKAVQEGFL